MSQPPAPVPFPRIRRPSRFTWALQATSFCAVSPLTGVCQTAELPGAWWSAEAQWDALPPDEWRRLAAFLAQLRGAAGRCYFGPVQAPNPQLAIADSPVVDGAGQTGTTLGTRGWTYGGNGLLPGDYLCFPAATGPELHLVVAATTIASDGTAALTLEPPLRSSPADGATIRLDHPVCLMGLASDAEAMLDQTSKTWAPASLKFAERLGPSGWFTFDLSTLDGPDLLL